MVSRGQQMAELNQDGLPSGTRYLGGRSIELACPPCITGGGLIASLVEHESIEMEVPAQVHHRVSIALGRRPSVWSDILGIKSARDLEPLNANIVPASHTTWVDEPTPGRFLFLRIAVDAGGQHEGDAFEPVPAFNYSDAVLQRAARCLLLMLRTPAIADDLKMGSIANAVATRLRYLNTASSPRCVPAIESWRKRQLVEFINANLHKRLSVEQLATIADLPVVEFLNAFHRSFGTPPFRYAAFARMRDIRARLAETTASPAHIADTLGYDYHALEAAFEAVVGIGMAEYQQLRRNR
ncbi:MAG: hypothetical protein C0471_14705 [Erythrobacter sp.]|nr:hypothetical protein [Erythrobacter sp.]